MRTVKHARHQWHQRLGMATLHRHCLMHAQVCSFGVEYSSRAGLERGIDRKDAHAGSEGHRPQKRMNR